MKARRNILKTLVIVGVGFILCYAWNTLYITIYHFSYPYFDFTRVFNFTVVMMYVGCCVNPIVYCIQYRQFQQGVRALFRCSATDSSTAIVARRIHPLPGTGMAASAARA